MRVCEAKGQRGSSKSVRATLREARNGGGGSGGGVGVADGGDFLAV